MANTTVSKNPAASPPPENPHYRLLGGDAGVRRLADRFYDIMDADPAAVTIRALHPVDLGHSREKLFEYLSGWLGGPRLYEAKYGHPHLRMRHMPFHIGERERDEWMYCMARAMADTGVEENLRAVLTEAFFKTADFLRNDGRRERNSR